MPPVLTERMMTKGDRSKASEPMMLCWDMDALPELQTDPMRTHPTKAGRVRLKDGERRSASNP
jgi:hypothetical protein